MIKCMGSGHNGAALACKKACVQSASHVHHPGPCARARQVDGDLDADGDEEPLDDDWGLDEAPA